MSPDEKVKIEITYREMAALMYAIDECKSKFLFRLRQRFSAILVEHFPMGVGPIGTFGGDEE
jgi:hypothetical protein